MNTLILNKNIDFEQYQQIVDYFATIGIEVALAREDVEKGNWIDGKELFDNIRKRYASKVVG